MKQKSRRQFFKNLTFGLIPVAAFDSMEWIQRIKRRVTRTAVSTPDRVFFTTGFKVMEVSDSSALIWTRLCGQEQPNPVKHQRRQQVFPHPLDFDENAPVAGMDGAVQGSAGWVRISVMGDNEKRQSPWMKASPDSDFTVSFLCEKLTPGKRYTLEIEGRSSKEGRSRMVNGTFATAPPEHETRPVNFVTSTCQYFWSFDDPERGFKTYDSMRKLQPDFFIHTGDYVYYDKPGPSATTPEKARHQWHAMDSWPAIRALYRTVPLFMIKDDHDLLKDDAYPGMSPYGNLTFEQGLKIWYENVPLKTKPYRTIRWGKDLQIWMVEGREFRSANTDPDGEKKSIWGAEQKQWFTESLEASDATFKLLFTATPVVGPDRERKRDNHANANFATEGDWLRKYLANQPGLFVVNGDRHWQYVSQDLESGLMEFGSGPVSDYHAQGWDPEDKRAEHQFLRVRGGFLNITVARKGGRPLISFIHRDVDGNAVHEQSFEGKA